MKSKQTSVEWLLNQILFLDWNHLQGSKKLEIFEQAKQMEKQQIMTAWDHGVLAQNDMTGEQYYNENYGK